MTIHEIAQLELAAVLFTVAGVATAFLSRWLIRRHKWPAVPTLCMAFILALGAAAFALADAEPGKPAPPQVRCWMRLKKEWVCWIHEVKTQWEELCVAIRQGFISVQGLYGEVVVITNSIPKEIAKPKAMQLRVNLLNNPNNQNFKARPTRLKNNGDGTWTVEITASREITDEPASMMYLRRKSDGMRWWVEHTSSSFPSNTAPNAFSYTFEMPVGVEGYIVVSDEVPLGGPHGLTVEGLALVDIAKGEIYAGIDGDFVDGEGRALQVRGGRFLIESAKAQAEPEPDPMPVKETGVITGVAPVKDLPGAALLREPVKAEPPLKLAMPPLKLAMPPLDGGAK